MGFQQLGAGHEKAVLCPGCLSLELTWASSGETSAGVALGDALCTEEDTADLCQPRDTPHMDFNAEFFF